MSVYLDASMLVALFTEDPHAARADTFLQSQTPQLIVSDFAAAEFASALARLVRTLELAEGDAREAFADLTHGQLGRHAGPQPLPRMLQSPEATCAASI